MTLLQHYQMGLLLTTIVTAIFGPWVFIKRRRDKVAQLFCLYALLVGFWSWCQFQAGSSPYPAVSLGWMRIAFYVVITYPVLLTHLFSAFLKIDQRNVCRYGWFLVIGFLPFTQSGWFLHPGGQLGFLPSFPRAGPLFLPFNIVWLGWIIYAFWILARGVPAGGPPPGRRQVRMLLAAFAFGYPMAVTNYLYAYGVIIPGLQPFATYGIPIAFLMIAYGIFAYGLFDIYVVIRKSLVYSLLVTLLTVGYFGLVYEVERLFQATFGYRSLSVSLMAFAVMALIFQPLKVGIQRLVDYLIFRAPQQTVAKRLEVYEERAREGDRYKTVATLSAGIAHELKNPLTAIQTFLDFFPQRGSDPGFRRQFQDVVGSEVKRLQQVAQGLLDFSKPQPPQMRPVEIQAVLDDVLALTNAELSGKSVSVKTSYTHNGSVVLGDAAQLKQAFLNLILNAKDAMAQGGALTIFTASANGHLEVHIADTGVGIHPKDLSHLFEPFFSKKSNGTGLGLSIVQHIIREHRGTISVQSTPGRGTTFIVKLPL